MRGVVLDVNVLVSSVIAALGIPRQVFSAWVLGRYPLVTSAGIIAEAEEKLTSPRIARRYGVTPELIAGTVTLLRTRASVVDVPVEERRAVTSDPEDDYVLATGRLGMAGHLVTGDRGLLAIGRHEGMAIVSPREFLELLNQTSPSST